MYLNIFVVNCCVQQGKQMSIKINIEKYYFALSWFVVLSLNSQQYLNIYVDVPIEICNSMPDRIMTGNLLYIVYGFKSSTNKKITSHAPTFLP